MRKIRVGISRCLLTRSMTAFCAARVDELNDLYGYILKKDSPSCGMDRVRVYGSEGMPRKNGRGLFAAGDHKGRPYLWHAGCSSPFQESEMVNTYKKLEQILNEEQIGSEMAVRALMATVFAECCPGCDDRFHTEEFIESFRHLIGELRLCKQISERSAA